MMRKISTIIIFMIAAQLLWALEPSVLNLRVPTGLEKKQMLVIIQHRFYGKINENPIDTHFGIDLGANVCIGMRYRILSNIDLGGSYTRSQKEYTMGAGYAISIPQIFLKSQVGIQYFDYKMPEISERRRNLFYNLALQSEPIFGKIMPVVNAGYDGYNKRFGFGAGVAIGFNLDFSYLRKLEIIGEYYPVFERDSTVTGPKNSFACGLKLSTFGHQFMFLISNNTEISARRLMLGASTNNLYFGFNVQRFINL